MKITPEIELPDLYEPFPEDLATLCHASIRGMKQMTVHRMVQRGQYKILASAELQDKPTRNSVPTIPAEEICEIAMQIIASDVAETDDPGNYKVSFVGVGGRGRKIVSKHIRMREEQSPRAVNTMDEGDLLETQMSYIGELHQVNMGLMEVVSGMIRPLLEENKEMMKICTESVKKVGLVEAARMSHELDVRRMEDENRIEMFKEQQSQEKWNELFGHVKSTGAMEEIIAGLKGHFTKEPKEDEPKKNTTPSPATASRPDQTKRPLPNPEEVSNLPAIRKPREVAKTKPPTNQVDKDTTAQEPTDTPGSDHSEKIEIQDIEKQVQEEMAKNPLVTLAQALKFSIDEKAQWKGIYKTLNHDQVEIFDEILSAKSDDQVKAGMDKMKKTSLAKLMMLRAMMDEDQTKILGAMLDA